MKKSACGFSAKREAFGFTLVELLVVIAIIAILASVVILIVNPLELMRRSRDATRLEGMSNLQKAISLSMQEATTSQNEILCNGADFPCFGRSGGPGASGRQNNGTGWVKVNLSSGGIVSLPALPVDPVNDGNYHYTYCADSTGWEINASLESEQLGMKMSSDGGNDADSFEVGSNYFLISPGGGSCEY